MLLLDLPSWLELRPYLLVGVAALHLGSLLWLVLTLILPRRPRP